MGIQDHFNKTGRILLGGRKKEAKAQSRAEQLYHQEYNAILDRWRSSSPSYPGLGPHTGHTFHGPFYDYELGDAQEAALESAVNLYLQEQGVSPVSHKEFQNMLRQQIQSKRSF